MQIILILGTFCKSLVFDFTHWSLTSVLVVNNRKVVSENDVLNIDVVNNRTVRVMCLALTQ